MTKRYGMRGIKYDNGDYLLEPDIVERHDGEYVRVEDYEKLKQSYEELHSIANWSIRRLNLSYRGYAQSMVDKLEKS